MNMSMGVFQINDHQFNIKIKSSATHSMCNDMHRSGHLNLTDLAQSSSHQGNLLWEHLDARAGKKFFCLFTLF